MHKSFFENNQDQSFWTSRKLIDFNSPTKEGQFYIPTRSVDTKDLITLKLNGKCLIMKDGNTEIFADIENARIQRLEQQGICLTKNQIEFQFYGDVDEFFQLLKQYCIQQDFLIKYHIISLIGQGNYAKVFKARNKFTLVENAVKVFEKHLFTQTTDKLALIKEVNILRQLQHSNIIQLHEVFETKSHIYLIFDYLSGGDLTSYLKQNTVTEEQSKQIILELLNALLFMHSKGIFHRDIKPQNLLLRKKLQINDLILCDFGLADYYRSNGKYMFVRCGTPGYVAPEILLDQLYDFKVDIYSLGVVLFVLLTGKPLFKGNNEAETIELNKNNQFDLNNYNLSPSCQDLLQGMLNTNPLQRFSIGQCKRHPWFLQEQPPLYLRLKYQMKNKISYQFDSEDSSPCSPNKLKRQFKIKMSSSSSTSSQDRKQQCAQICKTEPSETNNTKLRQLKQRYSTRKVDYH